MEHEHAFLHAIVEQPDDDLHRLAWADWLEEHDQADRAAFVRAQLRAAALPEDDPARDAAEDEADDLLALHETEWAGAVPELATEWEWRRGCIEHVAVSAAALLQHGEALFGQAPVRSVHLQGPQADLRGLADSALLGRVERLDLSFVRPTSPPVGATFHRDQALGPLLSAPALARLRELVVRRQGVEGPLVGTLAAAGVLGRLARLDVRGNAALGDRAVRTLAEAGAPRLEALDLRGTNVTHWGLRSVLAAAGLPRLRDVEFPFHLLLPPGAVRGPIVPDLPAVSRLTSLTLSDGVLPRVELADLLQSLFGLMRALPAGSLRRLDVSRQRLRVEDVAELADSPSLAGLRWLGLVMTRLQDSGARAFAASPHLGRLTYLDLGANQVGGPGIRALLDSPTLANLLGLNLAGNYVGATGADLIAGSDRPRRLTALNLADAHLDAPAAQLLAGSPALSRLRVLRLANNTLGNEGAAALAASPHLRRLRELDLDGNGIDSLGLQALVESPHLARLARLSVKSNPLTFRDVERLQARFGHRAQFL
jgi:uncharacterized protein (TIGR02996 family)